MYKIVNGRLELGPGELELDPSELEQDPGELEQDPGEDSRADLNGPPPPDTPPKKTDGKKKGRDLIPLTPTVRDKLINKKPVTITLRQGQCPGDILTLTAAVRDLKAKFNNVQLTMRTSAHPLWENNPHIMEAHSHSVEEGGQTDVDLNLSYPLINTANQCGKHFIHGFKEELESKLQISFPLTAFKCDVHLSQEEKQWANQVHHEFNYAGKFWVINSGSKNDFPLKQWSHAYWQEVVDALRGTVQFVQVGEEGHNHQPLEGVFNLIGKTDIRQLVRLCYHAEGAICHVTMLNHLMSVWEKPCVVIAGGRESAGWEAYNETSYLDTIGALPCCKSGGCWKSKVKDCLWMEGQYPRCMNMITPADVVRAVEKYYIGNRLKW